MLPSHVSHGHNAVTAVATSFERIHQKAPFYLVLWHLPLNVVHVYKGSFDLVEGLNLLQNALRPQMLKGCDDALSALSLNEALAVQTEFPPALLIEQLPSSKEYCCCNLHSPCCPFESIAMSKL